MDALCFPALASSALAFTIALAWNDAVSKTIKSFFPGASEKATARATLLYALVVTLLVIFVVAAIHHTHRVVRRWNGHSDEPASAPPSRDVGDCAACAKDCGLLRPAVQIRSAHLL